MEDRFKNEGKPLLGIDDTIFITSTVYAKTQDAFEALEERAVAAGYTKNPHGDKKEGAPFFSLEDIRMAACGSCDEVISCRGVRAHNHKCECCGEPTYLDYVEGGAIRFRFMNDRQYIGNPITFKIFEYREQEDGENELVLHADPLIENYSDDAKNVHVRIGWGDVNSRDEAQNVLDEARDLYRREKIKAGDQEIDTIVVRHHGPMLRENSVINTYETYGRVNNHRIIKIFDGQKYSEWDALPIPESFTLSKEYADGKKHSLTEPDIHGMIMQAAGQVSRADYYYQDGRPAFDSVALKRMTAFVHNFVDVEPKAWDRFLRAAPKDGPGFIYALAGWAAAESDGVRRHVKDEPNIGNALTGLSKIFSGKPLSYRESIAMEEGADTDAARQFAESLIETHQEKERAKIRGQIMSIGKTRREP